MGNWFRELGLFLFAMGAHWQSLATGGIVTAAIGLYERKKGRNMSWQSYVFVIVMFCMYSVFAAWQDEHRNTSRVEDEKANYASQTGDCQANLKATQGTLRDKESVADTFQRAFIAGQAPQAQQAANISTCINSMAKLNPKIHEEIVVISVPFAYLDATSNHVVGKASLFKHTISELFIVTNEVEPRFRGVLHCANDLQFTRPPAIPGNAQTVMTTTSPPTLIGDRDWEVSVQAGGEWDPSHPAYMQVVTKDEGTGNCTFTPKG